MLETRLITFSTEYLYDLFDDISIAAVENIYNHCSTRLFVTQVSLSRDYLMYKKCMYGNNEYSIIKVITYAGIIYCDIRNHYKTYKDIPSKHLRLLE